MLGIDEKDEDGATARTGSVARVRIKAKNVAVQIGEVDIEILIDVDDVLKLGERLRKLGTVVSNKGAGGSDG